MTKYKKIEKYFKILDKEVVSLENSQPLQVFEEIDVHKTISSSKVIDPSHSSSFFQIALRIIFNWVVNVLVSCIMLLYVKVDKNRAIIYSS